MGFFARFPKRVQCRVAPLRLSVAFRWFAILSGEVVDDAAGWNIQQVMTDTAKQLLDARFPVPRFGQRHLADGVGLCLSAKLKSSRYEPLRSCSDAMIGLLCQSNTSATFFPISYQPDAVFAEI
jgi:hypothetical protein